MISVIVPVFNMKDYLPECLDSLISQSFKDIELVLVDDGSTDPSGRICDEYAARDARIKVIHTRNAGLSAARNTGIDAAEGEWIMFVDSDDFVSPDFCRIPYETAVRENADMVIFQRINTDPDGKPIPRRNRPKKKPYGVLSHEEAADYGETAAWNKLYRRSLFKDIRFPEGRIYEDVCTTCMLMYEAEKIVLIPDRLYFYRYREDSLCHVRTPVNKRHAFEEYLARCRFLLGKGYPEKKAFGSLVGPALSACLYIDRGDPKYPAEAEKVLDSVREMPQALPPAKKFLLMLWKKNRRLFNAAGRLVRMEI